MSAHANARQSWPGRIEDDDLLRGRGRFGDDRREPNGAFACFVRSPHAFARIVRIDAAAAEDAPGVIAVLTGADLRSADYMSVTSPYPLDGCANLIAPHRPALAADRVMHVGEAVAAVIGENSGCAQDGADLVRVEYEELPPVTDCSGSSRINAPRLWRQAPDNIALDYAAPADPDGRNAAEIERRFATATHVASVDLSNQRIAAVSIEPRVATACYDPDQDRLTLRCGSQGVAGIQRELCTAMRLAPERLRVLTDDVGGGFGMKASSYPEYVLLLHAARLLGRPVHWTSTRSEAFQTDNQARDSLWTGELALDRDGRFLALRVQIVSNVGAYLTGVGHYCTTRHIAECLPGIYDIPYVSMRTRCVFSNMAPIGAYRGAGRPEANYFVERLIDRAARISSRDPAELRRLNILSSDRIPATTALGNTYDSGDFSGVFEKAMKLADYSGFAARRSASEKAGKLRGIGIGCYLENAGAFPEESVRISFDRDQRLRVSIGAGSSGQGHRTVFSRLVVERLGIPAGAVSVSSGDSSADVPGFGAVASRTAMMVGGAIANATEDIVAKGRRIAALLLQSDLASIGYRNGEFRNEDTGQSLSLFAVAARARELDRQGVVDEHLDTTASVTAGASFPNGCHVVEVEIDPETGAVRVVSYVGVDDCGNVLDPVIVDGQFHGAVAQGLGQSLCEAVRYDADSGQLVSGSFMDYGVPRAASMPPMTFVRHGVACQTNPLGVKGAGEAGTTAAPCAIVNAIADALPASAAEMLQMPVTSERVWRALQASSCVVS